VFQVLGKGELLELDEVYLDSFDILLVPEQYLSIVGGILALAISELKYYSILTHTRRLL
jgi:hypothetical protein